jgi:hypothetical protein
MLATAESKNQAVSKLESLVERGRLRAGNVIDHVMRNQPTDRLFRGDALQFRAADNLPEILITVPDREQGRVDQTLQRNAIYQIGPNHRHAGLAHDVLGSGPKLLNQLLDRTAA